jgi:uncharacterized protein (DUF58 family)
MVSLTPRCLSLGIIATLPVLWSLVDSRWLYLSLGAWLVLTVCAVADWALSLRADQCVAHRKVDPAVVAGKPFDVEIALQLKKTWSQVFEACDIVSGALSSWPAPIKVQVASQLGFRYTLQADARGQLLFEALAVRSVGPLGLAARVFRLPLSSSTQVFPDVLSLSRQALKHAAALQSKLRSTRPAVDGSSFDSLRTLSPEDAARSIDWKASAKRSVPLVRVLRGEDQQQVYLFVDCGRHQAGQADHRLKLDIVIDTALQIAAAALTSGDSVGLLAYGENVRAYLPARAGPSQLFTVARALQPIEARGEESSLSLAVSTFLARAPKRSLVVVFTEVEDLSVAPTLLSQINRLRPTHLPMIVGLSDTLLVDLSERKIHHTQQATEAVIASHFLEQAALTAAKLTQGGTLVLRALPSVVAKRAVQMYVEVKSKGLL